MKRILSLIGALAVCSLGASAPRGFDDTTLPPPTRLLQDTSIALVPYAPRAAIIPTGRAKICQLSRLDLVGFSEAEVCHLLSLPGLCPETAEKMSFSGGCVDFSEKVHVLTFAGGKVIRHEFDYRAPPASWGCNVGPRS